MVRTGDLKRDASAPRRRLYSSQTNPAKSPPHVSTSTEAFSPPRMNECRRETKKLLMIGIVAGKAAGRRHATSSGVGSWVWSTVTDRPTPAPPGGLRAPPGEGLPGGSLSKRGNPDERERGPTGFCEWRRSRRHCYYFNMQQFPPAHPLGSQGNVSVELFSPDVEALLEENTRLRSLVIYLSSLVIKNVVEPKS